MKATIAAWLGSPRIGSGPPPWEKYRIVAINSPGKKYTRARGYWIYSRQ
jgi:hypothetical protein